MTIFNTFLKQIKLPILKLMTVSLGEMFANFILFNHIALKTSKSLWSLEHSECNRVKEEILKYKKKIGRCTLNEIWPFLTI